MSNLKEEKQCIPGVTQPSHEAMQKALMFLMETSVPRLAAKRAKAMKNLRTDKLPRIND